MIPEIESGSGYIFADPDNNFYKQMLQIQLPEHNLNLDEPLLLRLLASSVSLSSEEKKETIKAIPRLTQRQADDILNILEKEVQQLRALGPSRAPQLQALEKRHQNEWKLLEKQLIADWSIAARSLVISLTAGGFSARCFTTFTPTLVTISPGSTKIKIATPLIETQRDSKRTAIGTALQDFEALINEPGTTEHIMHAFLRGHPEFLLGVDYRCLHSSVLLRSDRKGKRQADFMLEYHDHPYADILELKRPQDRIYCSIRSIRHLAGAVTRAIAQLHEYQNYFEDPTWRGGFMRRNGFTAYKPTLCLVIGRTTGLSYEEMRDMEVLHAGVKIWTYDDLRRRAEQFYQYRYGLRV